MGQAAEGNAAGDGLNAVRGRLERKAPDKEALEAERTALRKLVPGADIWYVDQWDHVSWHLSLSADSPDHLLEYLRDAGRDAEAGL